MKYHVARQDLMEGLSTVTRALSTRPTKQIFETVLVDADDTMLTLTCSDGNLTIQTEMPAIAEEVGRAALPGRLFFELARKLTGAEMSFRQAVGGYQSEISCDSVRTKLMGMDPEEYPEMTVVEEGVRISVSCQRLREMIGRVAFSVSTDESRQILTGVLMEVTATEMRLVALDGFRLAMQTVQGSFDTQGKELLRYVVPGRVMNELSRVLPDDPELMCDMLFSKTHLTASYGSTRVTTVLMAGEYIDYRRILPTSFKSVVSMDRLQLQGALELAGLMAREGKNNLVRMSFDQDSLTITASSELGDITDRKAAALEGDPIDIAFNAKYISDVIRNISDEELCMRFNSSISPSIIAPMEGNAYLYLILPVRVSL